MHPDDRRMLDTLTEPKSWNSANFHQILVSIGTLGNGVSIPAHNRPDSIHLQEWRDVIENLSERSKSEGKEFGRVLFVDTRNQKLIFSRVSVGDESKININSTPPDLSRARDFVVIGDVHTHPTHKGSYLTGHGMSPEDYYSLTSEPQQQFAMLSYGEFDRLLVLKTSATPNSLSPASIRKRISLAEKDFLKFEGGPIGSIKSVVDFNKAMCLEFALVMYIANKESADLFTRVDVTS